MQSSQDVVSVRDRGREGTLPRRRSEGSCPAVPVPTSKRICRTWLPDSFAHPIAARFPWSATSNWWSSTTPLRALEWADGRMRVVKSMRSRYGRGRRLTWAIA